MTEAAFILVLSGLLTGILFSLPAAGPISILIVSNGLKGRLRYCHRVAYGASVADLLYTFLAVYAFTNLYLYYQPYIPYFLLIGSVFLMGLGYHMTKKKINFEKVNDSTLIYEKNNNRGGFRTGLMVNFLNPTLFIGWLIASFLAITLVSSLGYNTGGLSVQMNHTIHDIENTELNKEIQEKKDALETVIGKLEAESDQTSPAEKQNGNGTARLVLSWLFAFSVATGSTLWFYFLGSFVVKWRYLFNPNTINRILTILGNVLILLGIFFLFSSIRDLLR